MSAILHFPDGKCDMGNCNFAGIAHDHAWPDAEVRQNRNPWRIPTVEEWKESGGPTIMHEGQEFIVPYSLNYCSHGHPDKSCFICYPLTEVEAGQ